jgi:hypothetical protein
MNSPRAIAAQKRCTTSLTMRSENCAIDPLLSSPHVYRAARRDELLLLAPGVAHASQRRPSQPRNDRSEPVSSRAKHRMSALAGARARGRAENCS